MSNVNAVCPHCTSVNRVPTTKLNDEPSCGKCHKTLFSGQTIALNEISFDKHLQSDELPLVIDFWAPWCGPCKMMAPALDQAANTLKAKVVVGKLNTEENQAIGARYEIRSIPTLVAFQAGKEIARQSGAMGASDIVRWIESVTPG